MHLHGICPPPGGGGGVQPRHYIYEHSRRYPVWPQQFLRTAFGSASMSMRVYDCFLPYNPWIDSRICDLSARFSTT